MTSQDQPAAGTIPHCYRHPDRETYISCQRCGKPICPDCMRQASVGFQCPDCVREGSASVRQPRTAFGGRVTPSTSIVTITLIAINVIVFVIANATGGLNGDFVARMSQSTSIDFPEAGLQGVAQGAYWQLITSTFLHVQFLHLVMNMIGLWIFGTFLEAQLGRWRYLALYLVSGLAGSVGVYLLTGPYVPGQGVTFSLGASGSVFGLFGAALLILLRQRRDVTALLVLLGLNLVITFTVPDISWQAHLFGLGAGLVMGAGFAYAPRSHRLAIHVGIVVGLVALCVLAVALRTAALTA